MRLTLRTLLSYLDDTLEPAQAKVMGAKVAESDQARELIERIKQVTRRRRLTTPPATGPGGMDSNTIAEYLDNEVKDEKATEVEQICLASDVHLAEVAACHQILTLVLGEPALVPPSAKQRMYKLVAGPESIQARKPRASGAEEDQDLSSEIDIEGVETMDGTTVGGTRGPSRNLLLYVGGGVLAACLFIVAVWQLTRPIHHDNLEPKEHEPIAQIEKDPGKKSDAPKVGDKAKTPADKKTDAEKSPPVTKEEKPQGIQQIPVTPVDPGPATPEILYKEASAKQAPVGRFLAPPVKAPAVLLQADKLGWARVAGKTGVVSSGRMLLSLPGSKSVVALDSGVELTLWGNLPEVTLDPLLGESRATLHANDTLDADLTLDRGRIVLRNDKKDGKDALARVRFADPTQRASEEHFDIILTTGSALAIELGAFMDRDEPFFEDPKDTLRKGPIATVGIYQYSGTATVKWGDLQYSVYDAMPILEWSSKGGRPSPPKGKAVLPPWIKGMPTFKPDDPLLRDRAIAVQAHDTIAKRLERGKQIDVVLAEFAEDLQNVTQKELMTKKGLTPELYLPWRQVFRCYAAIDDAGTLFDVFSREDTPAFERNLCLTTLQQWLPEARDNDYVLLKVIRKSNIKERASIKIMELFHQISAESAASPGTYQNLIEGLNNDLLPIRTLSYWHLFILAPAGRGIPYDPAMPRQLREMAVLQWLRLVQPGKLPPPPKKDKG